MCIWWVYNILVYNTSCCMYWDICACICQCQRPQSMFCIQLNSNVVFGLFFSSILTSGVLQFIFSFFSGIKYERERDGKKISCSAQFCEKFQTFPIKINSKESSNYFFFCYARETRKFFFPFRYHEKKNYFSFSCSCSCFYFLCWKNISFWYHRTKSRHIREKEKGTKKKK